jgi:hypothetical protein
LVTVRQLRLQSRARAAWPQLAAVHVRHRGAFAYVHGESADGQQVNLMRLRWLRSGARRGFALPDPAGDRYQAMVLPTGSLSGTPEEALDFACTIRLTALDG